MHIIDVINSLQLGQPDFGVFGAFFVESRPVGMFAALDSPPFSLTIRYQNSDNASPIVRAFHNLQKIGRLIRPLACMISLS